MTHYPRMALKRPQDELPSAKVKSIKLETVYHDPRNDQAGKKSLNDLKKEIYSLLSLFSENCGDFATGSVLSDLELHCFPNIEIQDYGILPLPINKLIFESIKPICLQSPYGLGEETLVDIAVRNSFQLDPQQFVIKNEEFDNQITALIEDKIKPNLGLKGTTIFGKIYKLLIYQPGGKFAEHRDTEKHQGMFGTLIIQLPSVFIGGDLIVKHCKSSKVFHNSSPEKSSLCSFVAHYASCPHELKEVTSGYRAALVYSLCWEGNGIKPSPYNASTNAVRLCNLLNEFMDKTDMFQWALDYEYSLSSIREGTVDFFKGCDKNIVSAVRNALQYDVMQCGKDRWEFFVARADKKVNEYGDCTREYGGYWGHHDGEEEDCFNKDWDEIDSIKLSNFIPLTPNTSKNDGLAFDFDPEEAVNGDDGFESWGDDKGTGCSGPTGNEGATCERWYQKQVAVLWRADKALSIKIRSGLCDGIFHVMSILKKGDLVEGMRGFQILWESHLNKVSTNHKNVSSLLEMCVILKLKEEACQLLKTMCEFGIPTDDSSNIVALAACQFKEDKNIIDALINLLRKSSKDQIKYILQCCSKIDWLTPTEVIDLTTDFILKNEISLGYRRYSYHNEHKETSIYPHIVGYMFKHKTFQLASIKKLVSLIDSMSDIESVICSLVECDENNVMIDHFLPRFASIASDALSSKTNKSYGWNRCEPEKSVTNVFKNLLFAKRSSLGKPLVTLVNSIKNLPNNFQGLLKLLTQQILQFFSDKENIPDCLLNAAKIRFDYLEGVIGKGVPQFSWHQPKAVVPGHPQVEQFLRGPAQSFTYRNFNNLKHARNWANKHSHDTGCFMTLTPIGRGSSAGVEVVKTRQSHQREVEIFEKDKLEYTKLLSILPENTNVLQQQVQIKQPTVEVIVLD